MNGELARQVATTAATHLGECLVVPGRPGAAPPDEQYGVLVLREQVTYWDYAAVVAAHPEWHTEIQRADKKGFEP